ncbi:MAG: cyclic nucleotide-binding domain-containing protein [Myxococcales bacterium]|nr:cyclic nucleotide-binding domain-containing protein [Myxococcales bacterium]
MIADQLRTLELFREFPDHDLDVLTNIARTLTFAPESTIIEQGERGRAAYVVLSGEVEVIRRLPGGTRTRLGVLQRGAVFGSVALLDGGQRAAICRAAGEVVVLEIASGDFQRLCAAATPLGTRFLMLVCRQLVRDLRTTNHRIAELAGLATLTAEAVASSVGGSLL